MDAIFETILQCFVLPKRRDRLRSKGLGSLSGVDDLHRFLDHSQAIETTSDELIRAIFKKIGVAPDGAVIARWDDPLVPDATQSEGITAYDAGRVMYVKWEVGGSLFISPPSRLAVARVLVRDSH